MIKSINDNVVFVSGAYNGAIYNFNTNKIYSLNHESRDFLFRYINDGIVKTEEESQYLCTLKELGLIGIDYKFDNYCPNTNNDNKLNFAWLEITQACNMRCIHCYEGNSHLTNKAQLSYDEWKDLIVDLKLCGCSNIQFIGGEPTCYKNLCELIDFATRLGFKSIGLFTNATMISEELFNCIVKNKINVNFSIYGHNAESHDRITQVKGSFDKTVSNIKAFVDKGINVIASIVIMKENEPYYEQIVEFVKSLEINKYKFDIVREVIGCQQNCHMVTRQDLVSKKIRTEAKFNISKDKFNRAFIENTCWYGKFAITETGDVIPCIFARNMPLGNIRVSSIKELLSSELLNNLWHLDFSQIDDCKVCEFRFACKDCRPQGMLNGSLTAKNIRCLYNPKNGVWNKLEV